ncbi:MAG: glycogen synthase GlgA [Candidatus Scalindua sp. AMX11]|nr:MAG: glycogen synthase GlgA [Candidatus Scalindua sp.]NOG85098.1 glycogen synthase GlgA [Planctomycetota bacterium]RZV69319.1 MAG: glycogen synthase GlgA [Candidatus Scalindua sp. SCAELEC01]TDE66770.1 MAG: glycogen synthase GlgA [Candidatus Scalindua sp. AMX11]GJQ60386.1 MAG: glycogen synthase [Candidatus Scalindua sp.]
MGIDFKIMFVSSEVAPFAKTGGLADVSGSLPKHLKNLGCDVRIVLPFYRMVQDQRLQHETIIEDLDVPSKGGILKAKIKQLSLEGCVPVYFISYNDFYDRGNLYGDLNGDYPDNAERFIFFCRSILELCKQLDFQPDIIHCNEWQTGLIPAYIKTLYRKDQFFTNTKTVFTIHNIAYQGIFEKEIFEKTGLPEEVFCYTGIEYYGKVNFMKAGIAYSEIINTVSQKYSKEIQTEEYGCGLQHILKDRSDSLFSVLNGVNYHEWNPETDVFIATNYNKDNVSGKIECKKDLLRNFALPLSLTERPLLGIISRLVEQKGIDLIVETIDRLMAFNIGFVLLGLGEERYHRLFQNFARRYPERVGIRIAYDNVLAHKIEAGVDIFLMPSRYEPCGLNQIYSLRYGTIPIVRATGGLDDTIRDYDQENEIGNGFKFKEYKTGAFLDKTRRALNVFENEEEWRQIMRNAMAEDFSWEISARKYIELYHKATSCP